MCMRVDLPLDKKIVENQGWVTGPLGRRGSRAVGLLLAKPVLECCNFLSYRFPSPDGKVLGQITWGQICWLALWVPESRLGVDTLFCTVFSDLNARFVSISQSVFSSPLRYMLMTAFTILDIVFFKSKRTAIAKSCEVTHENWRYMTPEVLTDWSQFSRFYSRLISTNMDFCDILKRWIINSMTWPQSVSIV